MAKTRNVSAVDVLRGIASGLRTAAVRPNVYGYAPHPKQLMFHRSPARGKLFIGGNRSGKTVGGGVEMVNRLMGRDSFKPVKHEPPVNCRAVGVDFDHGVDKIMKPEIARWLPPSSLINGSWEDSYDKQARTLTLSNKSTLEFMSYEQDLEKFAGTSRHATWFDEEPPQDIFIECNMRHLDVSGDWWMTMTPVEGMTWVYDDIYIAARTSEYLFVVEVETDENPFVNAGEIDIITAGLSNDEIQARRYGKFIQIGGLIYKMLDEKHFIESLIPPREWLHFNMMDHGFSNPTAWLWGAVDRDGRIIIFDEHYLSGEVVSFHAAVVHQKNLEHNRVPDYNVGDPSIRNTDPITGTSVQIEYIDHGIPILPGNNDVRAGINRVATKLTGLNGVPELYICKDNCPNLVWEIQRLRWATWANKKMDGKKNKKEEQHKKNDHACDALRYGVASRPQMDTGTYVPEVSDPRGASVAVSPYSGYTDPDLARSTEDAVDSVLGSEW